SVAGVDHHGAKRLARVLGGDLRWSRPRGAGDEESRKTKKQDLASQAKHRGFYIKTRLFAKGFSSARKNRLFFVRPDLKAFTSIMRTRLLLLPLLFLACTLTFAAKPTPAPKATAAPAPTTSKPVVDQTAQTIIYCYHRLVDKVRYPGTEITPAVFEAQMKELKDRGITVISLQDLLAWKRGEKNIPPRCAVITFDDGWKSQYEVAWPILKKLGYTFTMFIYTEGVAGASLGGGQAITWEMLGDMRDNGIDIEAHSATHQDLREGHTIMVMEPDRKRTKKKLTGAEYEQWLQNEVVGCKQLL